MFCIRVASWLGAAALVAAAPVLSHDLWIEPATYLTTPDDLVPVSLHIGHPGADGFEPIRRNSSQWERFSLIGPDGETEVPGLDGSTPAGVIRPQAPGRYTLVLRNRDATSRLPAAKFHDYLIEEGLERIAELREQRGEQDRPGTELYSRALKALVTVSADGTVPPGPPDRPLGLRLELVAETDPAQAAPGEPVRIRLLFEGEPLAGVLVEARHLEDTSRRLTARTDAHGRVRYDLDLQGPWLITAVHMIEAPPNGTADWQSIWAALTFQRAEATHPSR